MSDYSRILRVRIDGELSNLSYVEEYLGLKKNTLTKLYAKYSTDESQPVLVSIKDVKLELFKVRVKELTFKREDNR